MVVQKMEEEVEGVVEEDEAVEVIVEKQER